MKVSVARTVCRFSYLTFLSILHLQYREQLDRELDRVSGKLCSDCSVGADLALDDGKLLPLPSYEGNHPPLARLQVPRGKVAACQWQPVFILSLSRRPSFRFYLQGLEACLSLDTEQASNGLGVTASLVHSTPRAPCPLPPVALAFDDTEDNSTDLKNQLYLPRFSMETPWIGLPVSQCAPGLDATAAGMFGAPSVLYDAEFVPSIDLRLLDAVSPSPSLAVSPR